MRTFTKKRYRYCGKEKDEESGLYYYGARYYMAWACRFISIDPLAADYIHLTPYNYAGNKPITYYDIDGMQSNGEPQSANSTDNITPRPTSQDAKKGEWTDPQSGGRYSYDEGTGAWSATVPKGMEPTVTANMKRFVNGPIDVDAYYMKNSEGTYEQLTGPYSVIEGLTLSGQQVAEEYEKAQQKHKLEGFVAGVPAAIANYKRQEQEIKRLQWEIASLNNPASALMRLGTDGIKDIARETYDGNYKTAGTLTLLEFGPGKLFKFGGKALSKNTTLYRAVSQAELDDIAINGIRNVPGYETGKLFATSAQDAANFGRLNYGLDGQSFTIISTSIPNKYSSMLYGGEMDLMQGISVPKNLFGKLSKPNIFNKTPMPNHPWIK